MHTSHAATTITTIAKIWPSTLPHMRAKAISAMFAALSMSSRQSSTTSGLRRVSTPPAPMQNTSAETTRYQPMLIASAPVGGHRWPRSSNDALSRDVLPRCAGPDRRLERAVLRRARAALDGLGHRADAGRAQERHGADARLLLVVDAAAPACEDHGADR